MIANNRIRSQSGATLFIALTILILLTLLALSAAQVTGLQERMAGSYKADADAFHAAEDALRTAEREVLEDDTTCDQPASTPLPAGWEGDVDLREFEGGGTPAYIRIENLSEASADSSQRGIRLLGTAKSGESRTPGKYNCMVFRISAIQGDDPEEPSSRVILQSTFIP